MSVAKGGKDGTFFTVAGIEAPALAADQMRQEDRIPMEETGPNRFQMMINAGSVLALLAFKFMDAADG